MTIAFALVVTSLFACSKATTEDDSSSDSSSKASAALQTLSLDEDVRGLCYVAVLTSRGLLSWSALSAIGNAAGLVFGQDARAALDVWPASAFEAANSGAGADIIVRRSL